MLAPQAFECLAPIIFLLAIAKWVFGAFPVQNSAPGVCHGNGCGSAAVLVVLRANDLHKDPETTTWNLSLHSVHLKACSSIFPVVRLRVTQSKTLPIPDIVQKLWAWVSPVPPGEHNYCQQASAAPGPAQRPRPGASPMGTRGGDTWAWRWPGTA